MCKKEYNFKMFYMEPPIKEGKISKIRDFKSGDFDSALIDAKEFIETRSQGTMLIMLAIMDYVGE